MTEMQKEIVRNMTNEDLLDNYKHFAVKMSEDPDFTYVEFLDSIREEILKRMAN